MGDVKETPDNEAGAADGAAAVQDDPGRPSIDLLKETKELADITTLGTPFKMCTNVSKEGQVDVAEAAGVVQAPLAEEPLAKKPEAANIEMVYENVGLDKIVSSEAPLEPVIDPPQEITSHGSISTGRMNKLRDQSSNIFPAGIMGCKEDISNNSISPRRFIDATEAAKDSIGHIENTPRKMANSKSDHGRNPLTGTGVDSSDELKKIASKKKVDGNPLLGVGYDNKSSSNSSTRIPPGGFSHRLW